MISSTEKGRELTEQERKEFAPFIHHRRTRRQIAEVIDNISLASYTGNVVVTGEEGTESTAFAKLLIKDVQSMNVISPVRLQKNLRSSSEQEGHCRDVK